MKNPGIHTSMMVAAWLLLGTPATALAETGGAAGDLTMAALRTVVMLALVVALMLGLMWLLKRFNVPMARAVTTRRNLRVLESLPIAPRQSLVVVQAGTSVVLVGCSQQGTPSRF